MVGKKIIVAVSGSIAAYKSAQLVRLLVKAGAEVQVLMTEAATAFISPLTLSTLSRRPVYSRVAEEDEWANHVELGCWADAMVVAPATANTLADLALGRCANMVSAVYLSARCPVFFAPAMDLDMWAHPAVQENVRRLRSYGNHLVPVGVGELASGLQGPGRMAEPEDIVRTLARFFETGGPLSGKQALVTAGPTYEPIDPVRFVGNRSSGKMGVAIALALAEQGATVTLVLGPSVLQPRHPRLHLLRVETADEMFAAATEAFPHADITVLAAAVADYKPAETAPTKLKKSDGQRRLDLVRTPDIAATLGNRKQAGQLVVGFALETDRELEHATEKLVRKNFDFIVLNSLNDPGAGFQVDTNKVTLLFPDNIRKDFKLQSKDAVASDIVNEICLLSQASSS
jgi:phosphopantothenoylcysteine decarboxylase/phosphopantothenate--cysteine ligase